MATAAPSIESPTDTLISRVYRHAETQGETAFATFVEESGELTISWRDLFNRALCFASFLQANSVPPRDTVFVLAPLGPDLMAAFVGAMLANVVPALLSYPSSKVAPDVYARNLRGVLETTGARNVVTASALKDSLVGTLPSETQLLWIEEARMHEPSKSALERALVCPPDEIAFLQHSSGSTGIQKGVALSHRSVLNQVRHYSSTISLDPEQDVIASWLPLYHDMGLIASFMLPLAHGMRAIYLDPFKWVVDPATLLEAIHRHRATLTWLPNFAYNHMAKRIPPQRTENLDLSCVRGFINCSEPVRHQSQEGFLARFKQEGVRAEMLWVCYAMAENTFAVTHAGCTADRRVDWIDPAVLASEQRAESRDEGTGIAIVSCGPPIDGVSIRIVDKDRRSLPERRIGEIALSSNSMLTEYHKNPEATAKAIHEGYYFTGDLGYLADGHLYVTGRSKDLIIVGGRNFYPQDLEDVTSSVPGCIPGRNAAIAVNNEVLGTDEVIIVTESHDHASAGAADLRAHVQQAVLERLDCAVARVEIVAPGWIVKTSSGKVARAANLEKYKLLVESRKQQKAARAQTKGAPPPAIATLAEPVELLPAGESSLTVLALRIAAAILIMLLAAFLYDSSGANLYGRF